MQTISSADCVPRWSDTVPVSAATTPLISFGTPLPDALFVNARPLGRSSAVESWPLCQEVRFFSASADDPPSIEDATRQAYARLIAEAAAAGYPFFVRMWNFVGSINEHDAARERYQLFCAGRHQAFFDAGYQERAHLPAASAVGMKGRGLVTWCLASREPGRQIENRRQVSAWCYPPQYGPRSPSFSRATLWGDLLFVSGTASIVGHETLHAGDVDAQLDETLRNLEIVIGSGIPGGGLRDVIAARTYIRHASDHARIAARLEALFPQNLYLESDICRADLLLEIEVIARRAGR